MASARQEAVVSVVQSIPLSQTSGNKLPDDFEVLQVISPKDFSIY